jgi:hypothetical protein
MNRIKMERLSLHPFHWEFTYHGKRSKEVLTSISMRGLLASCTAGGTLEARNDNVSMATKSIRTSVDDDELGR